MLITRASRVPLKSQYTAYNWQWKRKNRFGVTRSTTPSFATPLTGAHKGSASNRVARISRVGYTNPSLVTESLLPTQ